MTIIVGVVAPTGDQSRVFKFTGDVVGTCHVRPFEFTNVPLLPLPEASAVVVPVPSSNL